MKNTRYSCQILRKLEFSGHIFEKYSNITSNENASSGNRVVLCGRTDGQIDRQTDITKLIVAFDVCVTVHHI